ncbi:MAG: hypothetical protein WA547_00230, partial [Thermoplasmata archaeon]
VGPTTSSTAAPESAPPMESPTAAAPVVEAPVPAPPKARRRAVRKRKAPQVISGTAGDIPPGVLGATTAPTPERPTEESPPKEVE